MNKRKLRNRLIGAASIGAASMATLMMVGSGVAFAAGSVPADPPGGATPTYPQFYNGTIERVRASGSDTTYYLIQHIADLFNDTALYGCSPNLGTGALYNTTTNSSPGDNGSDEGYYCLANSNTGTTDTADNWNRTEVDNGSTLIGSGNGQNQLCGGIDTPATLPVDFARSSKPVSTSTCPNGVEVGYAKDAVPMVDFQTLNPSTFSTSGQTTYYSSINSGDVGPVAEGWLPTDAVGGPYHGTAVTNLSNVDNGGGTGSTMYRIYCQAGGDQITDWGSLDNLGPTFAIVNATVSGGTLTAAPEASSDGSFTGSTAAVTFPSNVTGATLSGGGLPGGVTVTGGGGTTSLSLSNNSASASGNLTLTLASGQSAEAVGQGIPDGIPLRVQGVNTGSGTEATIAIDAKSGAASGCSTTDTNADADPNPATGGGLVNTTTNIAPQALENNAAQLAQYAESYFPADPRDQAIEIDTTLYYESNGVYNTTPFAAETQLWSTGTPGSGTSTTYTEDKVNENGEVPTTVNILNNNYPTARTLFNIYQSNTVRDATAGFLNWICETNGDNTTDANSNPVNKELDDVTGLNVDAELTTIISGQFGFPRLTDESAAPTGPATPADNQPSPNTTCASGTVVNGSGKTVGNGRPPVGDPNNGGTAPPNP